MSEELSFDGTINITYTVPLYEPGAEEKADLDELSAGLVRSGYRHQVVPSSVSKYANSARGVIPFIFEEHVVLEGSDLVESLDTVHFVKVFPSGFCCVGFRLRLDSAKTSQIMNILLILTRESDINIGGSPMRNYAFKSFKSMCDATGITIPDSAKGLQLSRRMIFEVRDITPHVTESREFMKRYSQQLYSICAPLRGIYRYEDFDQEITFKRIQEKRVELYGRKELIILTGSVSMVYMPYFDEITRSFCISVIELGLCHLIMLNWYRRTYSDAIKQLQEIVHGVSEKRYDINIDETEDQIRSYLSKKARLADQLQPIREKRLPLPLGRYNRIYRGALNTPNYDVFGMLEGLTRDLEGILTSLNELSVRAYTAKHATEQSRIRSAVEKLTAVFGSLVAGEITAALAPSIFPNNPLGQIGITVLMCSVATLFTVWMFRLKRKGK